MPTTEPFGHLVTLDLYGCDPDAIDSIDCCYAFLDALVARLGMTKQAPPFVFRSPGEFADKAGLSGWVPLIESGIQIHTLTPKCFVSVDIYCCRKFKTEHIVALAYQFFQHREAEMNYVARGTKYHEAV